MNIKFDIPKTNNSIIKVFGVGGGGGNAVNYMFRQGIKGVDFVVCNTDAQALDMSPVPIKLHIGAAITEGNGAGSNPEVGRKAAIENIDDIKQLLANNTKMVFITAGMGGGTGTGAAPIIAKAAKDMGILTVGIVTSPFGFEGPSRRNKANEGIENMKKSVDTLLVINNERLRNLYKNLSFAAAFGQADNILATAAKGIAELITVPGYVNVDFEDVKTVMANSGVAIMGSGTAQGDERALRSVKAALDSPLLNDNDINGAKYVLLNVTSGAKDVTMDEISIITEYIQEETGSHSELIFGTCVDEELGDSIMVTLIATGYESVAEKEDINNASKVIHQLDEDKANRLMQHIPLAPGAANLALPARNRPGTQQPQKEEPATSKTSLFHEDDENEPHLKTAPKPYDSLKSINDTIRNPRGLDKIENEPAYKRKDVKFRQVQHSSETNISRYTLSDDPEDTNPVKSNSYLHDNID
jgi:cell division protein FtsZ